MNSDVMVSICVPTYGHEKYIAEALDSILMQETKYSYEVLIGEDASPDGTRQILKEYEKKYPGIFQVFYREVNMRKQGKSNHKDLRKRAVGKYLIVLEGDDFWLSKNKIEKEVDFLEDHLEYIAVAHNCVVVGSDSKPNGESYPECKEEEYSLKHFFEGILPGQTATLLCRNYYRYPVFDTSILDKGLDPEDKLIYFALASFGKIYVMQETMSAYRHIVNGGYSCSANYKYSFSRNEHWYSELLMYSYKINKPEAIKIGERLYFRQLMVGLRVREISIAEMVKYTKKIQNRSRTILYVIAFYIWRWVNNKIRSE